jgi:chitin-binding protein
MKLRRTAAATALVTLPLLVAGPLTGSAAAHGTSQNPVSRVEQCSPQGGGNPENPTTKICKEAVAMSGKAAFYDPNAVNIGEAGGRHKQLIPDGKLCSAGKPGYEALDIPSTDWKSTELPSGGSYNFKFRATAQHKGTFEYYVTKDGFDPSKALKWSDLEAKPFMTSKDPVASSGAYNMTGTLPKKSGRHIVYVIWQRSDSQEAFYSCSDVTFGGGGTAPKKDTNTPATAAGSKAPAAKPESEAPQAKNVPPVVAPEPTMATTGGTAGVPSAAPQLAQTGAGDSNTPLVAGGAAAALAVGAGGLLIARRRRSA